MARDACPTCDCCNHCSSRHEGSMYSLDECPLDPFVSQERIEKVLREAGYDPETGFKKTLSLIELYECARVREKALAAVKEWHDGPAGLMFPIATVCEALGVTPARERKLIRFEAVVTAAQKLIRTFDRNDGWRDEMDALSDALTELDPGWEESDGA